MKIFQCGNCNHSLFFENDTCENCGHLSGYRAEDRMMLTFALDSTKLISDRENVEYKYCENKKYNVCNWVLEKNDEEVLCQACRLNRTIPNLNKKKNVKKWRKLEVAKHRLIYQLQKIGLPLLNKNEVEEGFCFDFIAKLDNPSIMTGHAYGVITILLKEADSVFREKTRIQLSEAYRSLIGHLRHEVGHYFWDRLIFPDKDLLKEFRNIFGNEKLDYSDSLKEYYDKGVESDWQESHISKYATAHAWEDWAETWAHYLHIMDMVENAYFFGLNVNPTGLFKEGKANASFDPYTIADFNTIVQTAVPVSFAVNSINRAMGVPDVYPFVIAPEVVDKMAFIHKLMLKYR